MQNNRLEKIINYILTHSSNFDKDWQLEGEYNFYPRFTYCIQPNKKLKYAITVVFSLNCKFIGETIVVVNPLKPFSFTNISIWKVVMDYRWLYKEGNFINIDRTLLSKLDIKKIEDTFIKRLQIIEGVDNKILESDEEVPSKLDKINKFIDDILP